MLAVIKLTQEADNIIEPAMTLQPMTPWVMVRMKMVLHKLTGNADMTDLKSESARKDTGYKKYISHYVPKTELYTVTEANVGKIVIFLIMCLKRSYTL